MKKNAKKIVLIITIIVIFLITFKLLFSPKNNFRAINMVPQNAFLIIETDNPFKAYKELNKSDIWKHMQTNSLFSEINSEIYTADSLIHENKILFTLFGSRKVLISIHQMHKEKYANLIVADMKNLSKLKILKNYLTNLDNSSYTVTTRKYQGYDIFEIYDRENKEMMYISFVQNLLVLTYNHFLLENSLKQCELPILARNPEFITISNQVQGDGQVRFYLNFKEIKKIFTIPNQENNTTLDSFLSLLYFGGLELNIKNNLLDLRGYLNGTDTIPTFINALAGTGKGGNNITSYIPQRTFMMAHFSFGSFTKLIENMEANLEREGLIDEYNKNKKRIERILDISVEENLISWIDDEIAVLNTKSKYKNEKAEYILVLKTKGERKAVKNLDFINAQIRKNAPVKFKSIKYKEIDIHYLSATGLFKIFFGKYFSKLDRPFYMVFNKHVYFSNHPQTLKDIIDDVSENKTLANWEEFSSFKNDVFDNNVNVFVYINTPIFADELKTNELKKYKKEIEDNKLFFDQLPFIGISLVSKDDIFKAQLAIQYKNELINDTLLHELLLSKQEYTLPSIIDLDPIKGQFPNTLESIIDSSESELPLNVNPFDVPNIVILELKKGIHKEYYSNKKIKMEVETNNGIKDGEFTWYYPNGEIKLKGKFKNDRQVSTWRYFDQNGILLEKKKLE